MNDKTSYKKEGLFIEEEEEPIPEKYSPNKKISKITLKQSSSQNNIHILAKSNKKSTQKSRISKLMNPTNINISHISRAKTTLNNLDSSKYENFNIQNQRYNFQKTYLYLHPDINHSFMKRMEFDVYKRQIKEKELDKLIEENKIKIEEERRIKTFNHLIEDANRRIEAMDNLEKMKKILNNNDITEQPLKKYTDEQWKKIYDERFKAYLEKVKEKKKNKLKNVLEQKIKEENDEINLCKVKKASKKHIEKESNKMYKEAIKMKMKKKEKIMRLKNNKKNKYIFVDEIEYEFSNKKKSNKKKNEKIHTFNDEENLIIKSNDISNCIIDKTSSCVQSIKESKNLEKLLEDSEKDIIKSNKNNKNNNDDNNNNTNVNYDDNNNKNNYDDDNNKYNNKDNGNEEFSENDKIKFDEKLKKIKYNFFDEEQKGDKNEINELNNNKENLNINNDKINNNMNKLKDPNKNLYNNEVSYIIDQFFLRNGSND